MKLPTSKPKRIYLINRDFQMRYVRLALLVGLCSTLLTTCLILFPLIHFRVIRFPNCLPDPFLWAIGAAALINFVIVAFIGVLVTHRIAGPMFSMTRHMLVMGTTKRLDFVRIRSSDDLKYLVRSFNNFIEFLRRQTQSDAARLAAIARQLQAGNGLEEGIAAIQELHAELEKRL